MRSFQQAARQVPQNRTSLPAAFSPKSGNSTCANSHGFELARTLSYRGQKNQDHLTETAKSLLPYGDAQCTDVATAVKGPQ